MFDMLINIVEWIVGGFLLFLVLLIVWAFIYGIYDIYIKKPDPMREKREDDLIAWADKIGIEEYHSYHSPYHGGTVSRGIPRNKRELRMMAELGLWAMSDGRGGKVSAEIAALPAEIDTMSNLVLINMSGNELETLPKEIVNLKHLRYLYIPDNRLKSLPDEITRLKLKALDIRNNPILC